jgi:integrase
MAGPLRAHLAACRLLKTESDEQARLRPHARKGDALRHGDPQGAYGLEEGGARADGPHECRHTYAAFMIAAGVNAKALSTYMGHSSITITLDRYGHLRPGNEEAAAAMLEGYLERDAG